MMTPRLFATPPPVVAVEVTARQIAAVRVSAGRQRPAMLAYAAEALPDGVVAPSLTSANVADPAALAARLRRVLARIGVAPRRLALLVPDPVAKVSIVRLARVPSRRSDLEALLQFQVRKAAPFPIDEAQVSWTDGAGAGEDGRDFVVTVARRSIVAEYERACELAGVHAGLVDLSTFNVVNAVLAGGDAPAGDWLLVHVTPDDSSIAILRGPHLLFFRNRPGDDQTSLGDLVHQTAMYYQDRLDGRGFERVRMAGWHASLGAEAGAWRAQIETRLGVPMEPVDPTRLVTFADRIGVSPDVADQIVPLVGVLTRDRAGRDGGGR